MLQGIDFLELHRRHGVSLQFGGNDQWGNLLSGVELIHKVEGHDAHALTTPLVTKADGTKFGKSEGGAIWLDPELTSPYAFHQFWLNAADADVVNYLKYFTFRTQEEIAELEQATQEASHKRAAQRALADELTTMVHGQQATDQATAAAAVLFGRGDVRELDEATVSLDRPGAPECRARCDDSVDRCLRRDRHRPVQGSRTARAPTRRIVSLNGEKSLPMPWPRRSEMSSCCPVQSSAAAPRTEERRDGAPGRLTPFPTRTPRSLLSGGVGAFGVPRCPPGQARFAPGAGRAGSGACLERAVPRHCHGIVWCSNSS